MDTYVTGDVIRRLREEKRMTQDALAQKLFVSAKAVSKWETGKGFPDVSLLEPLAAALGISVAELFSGSAVRNGNRSADMRKTRLYVCPVCGNVIAAAGEASVACCGLTLPPLEPEEPDAAHGIRVEISDGAYFVSLDHPMTKTHFISFLCAASDQSFRLVKLYPESDASARFGIERVRFLYAYCSRHGLFRVRL